MKKRMIGKGIVLGIIILFFGAGVISAIDNNTEKKDSIVTKSNEYTGFIGLDDGLVGYWSFDEDSGNIAYDDSEYVNDGLIYGATQISGVSNNALSFDGIDDYIDYGDKIHFDITGDITIALWFKTDTIQRGVLINKYDPANPDNGYILMFDDGFWEPDGTISYKLALNSHDYADYDIFSTTSTYTDAIWHFLTAIYTPDGVSRAKIYIDAEEQSGDYYFHALTSIGASPGYNFKIGEYSSGHSQNFDGSMDEVRIYDRALSEAEIQELYENPSGLKSIFMFGKIDNLNLGAGNFITFDAEKVRAIQFSPFSFNTYESGETFRISEDKIGLLLPGFIFGFFNTNI